MTKGDAETALVGLSALVPLLVVCAVQAQQPIPEPDVIFIGRRENVQDTPSVALKVEESGDILVDGLQVSSGQCIARVYLASTADGAQIPPGFTSVGKQMEIVGDNVRQGYVIGR